MALPTISRLHLPWGGGRWLSPRAEGVALDVLAAVVGAAGELSLLYDDGSPVRPVPVVLTVVAGAALLIRRRQPLLVLAAMLATTGALFALGESPGGALALVALFTVGEQCSTRVSLTALVGTAAVLVALSVTSVPPPLIAWGAGAALRSRRRHHDEERERIAASRLEREQRAAITAHEERAAIARELHDIVAHSVTVMLVGVRGARDVVMTAPETAADVLARVETSGEQSILELRRLLALLRSATPSTLAAAPNRPLPGLADLPALVDDFGAAGLSVDLEHTGGPTPLDEGVGLSVYRITEEALTNVVRHARTDHATVRVSYDPDRIRLEILDEGSGPPDDGAPLGGHGIVGMRERALLLGGSLSAGPGPLAGFRVTADLPTGGER